MDVINAMFWMIMGVMCVNFAAVVPLLLLVLHGALTVCGWLILAPYYMFNAIKEKLN